MSHILFVYGTLKRGFHNNRLLVEGGAKFLGTDEAPGKLYGRTERDGWHPPVPVVTPEEGWVRGELFEVDEATLTRCDRLEGHPRAYLREEVVLRSGKRAWIYRWPHKPWGAECVSGSWPEPAGWHALTTDELRAAARKHAKKSTGWKKMNRSQLIQLMSEIFS